MPVLSNARHELFAQEIAKGKNTSEAYVNAGYNHNPGNAVRLKIKDNVSARITELLQRSAQKSVVTIETITEMYLEDRRLAQAAGQLAVSKSAADSLAKLHGLMIERSENGKPGDFSRMSDDELERFIKERSRASGGSLERTGTAH